MIIVRLRIHMSNMSGNEERNHKDTYHDYFTRWTGMRLRVAHAKKRARIQPYTKLRTHMIHTNTSTERDNASKEKR